MSRLDSAIRRLQAQRACLDHAAALIADRDGIILEFGLGNGRTYDHLRGLFPERDIYVFERAVRAHPDCIPDADHLFEGDFFDTLPTAIARLGATAVLAHCDIGSGDAAESAALAAALASAMAPLLAPGAVVMSDLAMGTTRLATLDLPDGVDEGRYFLYRSD